MLFALVFLAELIILFLLSQNLTNAFARLFYEFSKSKHHMTHLLAFLFFPGTFLHELAHYLAAIFLRVPVGKMTLLPQREGNTIKLGSVSIAHTDPFRRLLIGTAPVFLGLTIILGAIYLTFHHNLLNNHWIILGIGFLIFEIGNTMFSSKKDMEGTLGLLLVVVIIAGICYLLGFRIEGTNIMNFFSQPIIATIFQTGSLYLFIPVSIDVLLILLLKSFR